MTATWRSIVEAGPAALTEMSPGSATSVVREEAARPVAHRR